MYYVSFLHSSTGLSSAIFLFSYYIAYVLMTSVWHATVRCPAGVNLIPASFNIALLPYLYCVLLPGWRPFGGLCRHTYHFGPSCVLN